MKRNNAYTEKTKGTSVRKRKAQLEGSGRAALITGATSGIGAEYARALASRGYDLILTGRRKEKIADLARELQAAHGICAEIVIAELSDEKDVKKLVDLAGKRKDIEVLVNNAGFGSGKQFHEDETGRAEAMLKVHNEVPVRLIHAVIPGMRTLGKGMIVNVSSLSAVIPNSGDAMYPSTKAFLNVFSESLHMELRPFGIKVQALCPGFTRTDFHERLGYEQGELKSFFIVRWMTAADVVRRSLKKLGNGRPVYVPGFWNKVIRLIVTKLPKRLYYILFARGRAIRRKKPASSQAAGRGTNRSAVVRMGLKRRR